jgi:hypothetical protein
MSAKRGLIMESSWHMPINERMINKSPKGEWWLKNKGNLKA